MNTADLSEFSPGIMKQAEIRHAYAEGKRIAEIYLAHFAQRCGWDRVSIGRFFDVFGERAWRPRMITNFVTRALRGEDVVLYGDGEQYRNPTYVKDVCDAVCICIERGGIYNIASQTHMRVKDVVSKISEIVGDVRIRFGDALPCDTRRRVAKTDTIRRAGWSEKYGFNEGLRRTVQWWKDGEKYNLVRW